MRIVDWSSDVCSSELREKTDAGTATGTALMANDALHRHHVAKTPELEAGFDIDQQLAQVVGLPVGRRIAIDRRQHRHQRRGEHVWLRPVATNALRRQHMALTVQVQQQLVIQTRGFQRRAQTRLCQRVVGEHRSEELRVGNECLSSCRSWWSPYLLKKKEHK